VPTQLDLARHLDGLHEAVTAFVAYADRAGLEAAVPTCPDWSVLDLVAHQGMVHRWAAALVRGERPSAPENVSAPVFLNDAPPARRFWARRQCHETTMHAVDALAASLGRPPKAGEVWIEAELAGDGIDELLGGFLTRPRTPLRQDDEALLVVRPDDLPDWWEVRLGPRPAVTTRHSSDDEPPDADWELTGGAVEFYLRLWNRTHPPEEWRQLTAVSWG
jgi:hypothetical protein